MKRVLSFSLILMMCLIIACTGKKQEPLISGEGDSIQKVAQTYFGILPVEAATQSNIVTPEKVFLGKTLFYDTRLSAKSS